MMTQYFLAAGLLMMSTFAYSQVKQKPLIQIFKNSECEINETCDLKEFKLQTYDYSVQYPDGKSFGTGAYISYKTDKVDQLEKYAVVQFIRGCSYYSDDDPNKDLVQIKREFFGEISPFHHPDWVIDSVDKDPIYNSLSTGNRHRAYRWNTVPGSTNNATEAYYSEGIPSNPELYVRDLPGTAFYLNGRAKNLSLNFKVCLYKTADVPLETKQDDLSFANPIHCFDWDSSFVYNHKLKKMERSKKLNPICTEKV